MNWKDKVAKYLGLDARIDAEIEARVKAEVRAARQAMPISLDWDPKGEGYRKISGAGSDQAARNLTPVSQDLMIELAYYLYDSSGLVKRFVRDTKNFVLGEGVSYTVENDPDGKAKEILDAFWGDSVNQMDLRLEKRVEFLGLLGEQCYPVSVNPQNGHVWLSYVDPANIDEVITVQGFPEMTAAVKLKGRGGRTGDTLTAIRTETNYRKREHGYLVGNCFFFAINNPPNGPRGRSDLIHLFDFINGFEEGLFDELDRLKLIKAFIWDATLSGATDDDIKTFLQNNRTPKSGTVRAHNESVKWEAIAPDLKMADNKQLFDLMRTYLAACANRPDSWLGSGGKAYQTEADLMGEPTFKDLGSRARYVKYILEHQLQFALDQAVLAGVLRETTEGRFKAVVSMPEMTTKDLAKIVAALFSMAQALMLAETNGWASKESAAEMFWGVAAQMGVEKDAAEEIEKAARGSLVTEDYAAREAMIKVIVDRIEAKHPRLQVVNK